MKFNMDQLKEKPKTLYLLTFVINFLAFIWVFLLSGSGCGPSPESVSAKKFLLRDLARGGPLADSLEGVSNSTNGQAVAYADFFPKNITYKESSVLSTFFVWPSNQDIQVTKERAIERISSLESDLAKTETREMPAGEAGTEVNMVEKLKSNLEVYRSISTVNTLDDVTAIVGKHSTLLDKIYSEDHTLVKEVNRAEAEYTPVKNDFYGRKENEKNLAIKAFRDKYTCLLKTNANGTLHRDNVCVRTANAEDNINEVKSLENCEEIANRPFISFFYKGCDLFMLSVKKVNDVPLDKLPALIQIKDKFHTVIAQNGIRKSKPLKSFEEGNPIAALSFDGSLQHLSNEQCDFLVTKGGHYLHITDEAEAKKEVVSCSKVSEDFSAENIATEFNNKFADLIKRYDSAKKAYVDFNIGPKVDREINYVMRAVDPEQLPNKMQNWIASTYNKSGIIYDAKNDEFRIKLALTFNNLSEQGEATAPELIYQWSSKEESLKDKESLEGEIEQVRLYRENNVPCISFVLREKRKLNVGGAGMSAGESVNDKQVEFNGNYYQVVLRQSITPFGLVLVGPLKKFDSANNLMGRGMVKVIMEEAI